jgi:hypothetical protein
VYKTDNALMLELFRADGEAPRVISRSTSRSVSSMVFIFITSCVF